MSNWLRVIREASSCCTMYIVGDYLRFVAKSCEVEAMLGDVREWMSFEDDAHDVKNLKLEHRAS
jgi:hypothetical protein